MQAMASNINITPSQAPIMSGVAIKLPTVIDPHEPEQDFLARLKQEYPDAVNIPPEKNHLLRQS